MSVNSWFWRDSSKWKNSRFQALFLLWSSRLLNNTVCPRLLNNVVCPRLLNNMVCPRLLLRPGALPHCMWGRLLSVHKARGPLLRGQGHHTTSCCLQLQGALFSQPPLELMWGHCSLFFAFSAFPVSGASSVSLGLGTQERTVLVYLLHLLCARQALGGLYFSAWCVGGPDTRAGPGQDVTCSVLDASQDRREGEGESEEGLASLEGASPQ